MGIYKELGYTTSISKVSENVFKRIIVCCNLIYFPTLHKSFWLLKTNISSKTVKNIFELDKWMLFHFPIFDRPFLVTQQKIFLYPLKSSENLWFSGVSRGYRKKPMTLSELKGKRHLLNVNNKDNRMKNRWAISKNSHWTKSLCKFLLIHRANTLLKSKIKAIEKQKRSSRVFTINNYLFTEHLESNVILLYLSEKSENRKGFRFVTLGANELKCAKEFQYPYFILKTS